MPRCTNSRLTEKGALGSARPYGSRRFEQGVTMPLSLRWTGRAGEAKLAAFFRRHGRHGSAARFAASGCSSRLSFARLPLSARSAYPQPSPAEGSSHVLRGVGVELEKTRRWHRIPPVPERD
jgi:hypothetical protein